ncbi:hypothetical protein [Halorussus pelagicus]|uniref:hypothetical protein n=1 Tax=Halorussus pelagicus TaxID=2505977 RepID=UPI000FFB5170|nr:hypothetical protein [Halorussus pelagicus]
MIGDVNDDRIQFYALYLTRFESGFGVVTLLTLLPRYIMRNSPPPEARGREGSGGVVQSEAD